MNSNALSKPIILVFMVTLIASLVGFLGYVLFPTIEKGGDAIEQVSTCTGIVTGLSVQKCLIEHTSPQTLLVTVQRDATSTEVVDIAFFIETEENLRERILSENITPLNGVMLPVQGSSGLYRIQTPRLGSIRVAPIIITEKKVRSLCPPSVVEAVCISA